MHIRHENNLIEIVQLDRIPAGAPSAGDVQVSVSVRLADFAGQHDQVWIDAEALQHFVDSLRVIEQERRGVAVLESMSLNEFKLEIRSRDQLGHFVAAVSLSRHQYSGPNSWPTSVSGGFEIDPSDLPGLLLEFEKLQR